MSKLTLSDRVSVPEDVVSQEVGGERVLLNLDTGMYYGLNPIGNRLWVLITQHGSLQAAFDVMLGEYEVPPEKLEQDILRLADEFQAKGLVRVVS